MTWGDHLRPEQKLGNRVGWLLSAVTGVTDTWAQYLIDPRLDNEPELRNRIFPILIYALAESAQEIGPRLAPLRKEASRLNAASALHYIDFAAFYIDGAIDLVSNFNCDEMILLGEHRHQIVHGRLDEVHKHSRIVRSVLNGRIVSSKINSEEYWAAYRTLVHGNLDDALEKLRRRFYEAPTLFWTAHLWANMHKQHIADDLTNPATSPRVGFTINCHGYQATKAEAIEKGGGHNLLAIRREVPFGPTRRDPVIPTAS